MTDFSKYPLSIRKSPVDKRDHKLSLVLPEVVLPRKTNNAATAAPFRDQGAYPRCAGMTAALVKWWQEHKEVGLIDPLAPRFTYDLREDPTEEGMYGRDLMQILKDYGICLEKLAPYESTEPLSLEAFKDAKKRVIDKYALADSLDALKRSLFLNGPQFMCVPVYNYTDRMWKQRPGDILLGGHMMEVLDYDDDRCKLPYQNHWNGWGDKNGRAEMDYADFDLIWEFWCAYDAPTPVDPIPDPEPQPEKRNWFGRWGKWVLLGLLSAGTTLYFLLR